MVVESYKQLQMLDSNQQGFTSTSLKNILAYSAQGWIKAIN